MKNSHSQILVTGSTGFVGRALIDKLLSDSGHGLRAVTRNSIDTSFGAVETVEVKDLSSSTDWTIALKKVDVVIHLAARVHVMNDMSLDPLTEFREVNVEGTLNLARQAVAAGVKRFIFISSIKVNGELTQLGHPFKADDAPAPIDPYGISKMEAEHGLQILAAKTGMEVVIIRPVLVYGPRVKANFFNMMKWLNRSIPLPLGAIHNKRSLVAIENLVDLINTCVSHPKAANQIFLVSDGNDLSTSELLRFMAVALRKSLVLLPVPSVVLEVFASLFGKRAVCQRLCGSLQVDISKTQLLLNWIPPVSVDEALAKTARYFQETL
jgi:nucleoside-diphosphate-sugar epimerase